MMKPLANYGDLLDRPIHPSCRHGCQAHGAGETVAALTKQVEELRTEAQFALDMLENLTTEGYRKGDDFVARQRLHTVLAKYAKPVSDGE